MYGLTRGTLTLIGVAIAGFLIWLASHIFRARDFFHASPGRYWLWMGLLAAGGLVMALSQLLGGWTKWGLPRISGSVFMLAFLPTLVVGGWILFYAQPGDPWLARHVRSWSGDLGLRSFVEHLLRGGFAAIPFLIGLTFGLTFDTSGPRVRRAVAAPARTDGVDTPAVAGAGAVPDAETRVPPAPQARDREGAAPASTGAGAPSEPPPEAPPGSAAPDDTHNP
jgi:hypothetical protein